MPEKTMSAAKKEWPDAENIIYDKSVKGYLPTLAGLSSFGADTAADALSRGQHWSSGNIHPYLVLYEAKDVGTGPDGEYLTKPIPVGKEFIFQNPNSKKKG